MGFSVAYLDVSSQETDIGKLGIIYFECGDWEPSTGDEEGGTSIFDMSGTESQEAFDNNSNNESDETSDGTTPDTVDEAE